MKKLMTLITAVALGAFAWAAEFTGSVTYSVADKGFQDGSTNIVGYTDDAQTSFFDITGEQKIYWWGANFPTNEAELTSYEQPAEVATAAQIGEDTDVKYLKIEADTAAPMLRMFGDVTPGDEVGGAGSGIYSPTYNRYEIGDHGTYVDTMVSLSASEEPPQDFDGKIAVWLQVIPAEEATETTDAVEGSTNLMITCAALNDQYKPTLTNIPVNVSIAPDTWHRITIRSIKTIKSGKNIPGFVIFVDENPVAAKEGFYPTIPEVDADIAHFYTDRQLFVSAGDSSSENAQSLESVGFSGNGGLSKIDLLTATDVDFFAKDTTYVKFTWDEHVESIKIGDEEEEIVDKATTAGEYSFPVQKFGESNPFVAKVTYKEGFRRHEITGAGFVGFNEDPANTLTFSLAEFAAPTVDVVSEVARDGASFSILWRGTGTPVAMGAKPYLVDVIDIIKNMSDTEKPGDPAEGLLGYDDTVYITLQEDELDCLGLGFDVNISCKIVLDLNGHSITAAENAGVAYLFGDVYVDLTICDGSTDGGSSIIGSTEIGIIDNYFNITIEAATGTDPITFVGAINNVNGVSCLINGGKFAPKPDMESEFESEKIGKLGEGLKWEEEVIETVTWYNVVQAGTKTVTFTTNDAIGSYAVYTNGNVEVDVVNNRAAIDELDPFTVAFTVAEHYNIGDTTGWTLNGNVYTKDFDADTTAVTLPVGTAITFDVTFADAADGSATITPAAGTSNLVEGTELTITATAAEDYEYVETGSYGDWVWVDSSTLTLAYEVTEDDEVTAPNATAVGPTVYFPQADIEEQYKDRDGTAALPFVIRKYEDLVALQSMVADGQTTAGVYFEQVADIDMSATATDGWVGIGTLEYALGENPTFKGVYDGGNHQIYNLTFANKDYNGLFASAYYATIRNLKIAVTGIKGGGAAAFVGVAEMCQLSNLLATGAIGTEAAPASHTCAGIVVRCQGTTVFACTNRCEIYTSKGKLGGIAGYGQGNKTDPDSNSLIEECSNEGALHNTKTDLNSEYGVGGIYGDAFNSPVQIVEIKNCRSIGALYTADPNYMNSQHPHGVLQGRCENNGSFTGTNIVINNGWRMLGSHDRADITYAEVIDDGQYLKLYDMRGRTFELGKTYKTVQSGLTPTYQFTEAGSISFDTNMYKAAAFNVTGNPAEKFDITSNDVDGVVTFTAAIKTYTITFGANGGSGEQASINYTWNEEKLAPACTFTPPENATFNCWSNATDNSIFAVGAPLDTDLGDYELVADWTIAAPAEITVTVKKGTGIASVTVGGKELDFENDEATFTVPVAAPTAQVTLEADDITIPVYKMSIGNPVVGSGVTNKTPVITADANDLSKNYVTFTAAEADVNDPQVEESDKKQAIIDAIDGEAGDADHDAAVAKVNAIVTTEATPAEGGKVTATELATYIKVKNVHSSDLAESDYVVASVKLGTDSLIDEDTVVKVNTVEKTTSDLAVTIKVGDEDATKEQIESYVEVCDDLGAANDWEKLPQSTLKSAVTITDGKLVITPVAGIDKLFLKVVIPQDPKGVE